MVNIRFHVLKSKKRNDKMKFYCPFDCGYETVFYKWMIKHIWSFHAILPNFSVKCGFSGCVKTFTCEKSFKRHFRANHKDFYKKHMKNDVKNESEIENITVEDAENVEDDPNECSHGYENNTILTIS